MERKTENNLTPSSVGTTTGGYQFRGLYQQKDYERIIALYEETQESDDFTEWDYFYIMEAHYKRKKYEACLEVYRNFHNKYPASGRLDNKMGWSLYYTHIKGTEITPNNRDDYKKRIDYIIKHSDDTQYSPRGRMIILMADAIDKGKMGNSRNYAEMRRYLEMTQPATLSEEPFEMEREGRTTEAPSARERWYTLYSKALLELKEYKKCIEVLQEAEQTIHPLHNNNDVWFPYRRARAMKATGDAAEAKAITLKLLEGRFSHWCLYQLLYELTYNAAPEEALQYGAECALSDNSHDMRVNFYADFAAFLQEHGHTREADLHRQLILHVCREKNWTIRTAWRWELPPEITDLSMSDVLRELKAFWRQLKTSNMPFYEGKVKNFISEGRAGFITSEGRDYYFNMRDVNARKDSLEVDTKVRFALKDKLDRRRNEVRPTAVEISIVE